MMSMFRPLALTALVILAGSLHAATLIEQRDAESHTILYVEGTQMRAETPGQPGYMLMDFKAGTMYMVSPEEKTVIDNSNMMRAMREDKAEPAGRQPSVRFEHKGAGPDIAGYRTEHYVEYADGVRCGDLFLSKEAMADSGFSDFMDAMDAAGLSNSGEETNPCDWQSSEGLGFIRDNGYPLRELDADGALSNEVTRIQTNAVLPAGGFELPADYRVMTMEQMMQGMGGMAMPGMGHDDADEEYGDDMALPDGMQDEEAEEALEQVKSLLESMKDRGN